MKTLILIALTCSAATQAATIFNFDNDNVGTTTTFTDTSNGIAATFSSSADPGAFTVQPTIFDTLTGNVLGSPGPAFLNNVSLNINFNTQLSAISLIFATADFNTPSPFSIAAYEGATLVGTNTLPGMFLNGFLFPEGEIAFSGANFDNVVLSTTAPNFAIDNVTVQPSAVPEPKSLWMLALGLAAVVLSATTRRRCA